MTIFLGGNPISSTQDQHHTHYPHLKHITGKTAVPHVCYIGGMPICCFDLGDGAYALGVYEITSGLTDHGETIVETGNRLNVTSFTDNRRVLETVKQSGGASVLSSVTVWNGARLGINADGSLLVQALVATENSLDASASASIGGVPMRVVRVGNNWYLAVHTSSTI